VRPLPDILRVALAAMLIAAGPAAAQKVTVERDTPLYSEPRLESSHVAQLQAGTVAEVAGKQGAWLNLRTQAGAGWLFSFNVRFQSEGAGEASGSGTGSVLGRLFAPRRSTVSVTSTIGVRGIEEEDLKQATFDAGQVKLLEGYSASKESAEQGARGAGLSPASVEYLDKK
jgi:hypothetical protein